FDDEISSQVMLFFQWSPFGIVFQLPFDIIGANWQIAVCRFLVIMLYAGIFIAVSLYCMSKQNVLYAAKSNTAKVHIQGLGIFKHVPNSQFGALVARILTVKLRDMRFYYTIFMMILVSVLVIVVPILRDGFDDPSLFWFGLIFSLITLIGMEGNNVALDGTQYISQQTYNVPGRVDRLAHLIVMSVFNLIYVCIGITLIGLIMAIVEPNAHNFDFYWYGFCVVLTVALAPIGIGQLTSVVVMYPVPSIDSPTGTSQSTGLKKVIVPIISLIILYLSTTPMVVMFILHIYFPQWNLIIKVLLPIVCLLNIAVCDYVGVMLGGRLLEKRRLQIIEQLEYFKSVLK
ncbi:MAG: hypothetical protein Q3961_04315, partial [Bifidobacteriaceae bacterium]|nr:hypothetical protein [Bifidobacteriaceae bacterium]